MLEGILQSTQYAPLIIFIAAVLDIFFVSGLFLYGIAMMSLTAILYSTGVMTVEALLIASFSGTLFGNALNYYFGRFFRTREIVAKHLEHPKAIKARGFLRSRGLFVYVLACRFIAVTRPLYALLLGSLGISAKRFFLYEILIAFAWSAFWLYIIIQGEALFSYFLG